MLLACLNLEFGEECQSQLLQASPADWEKLVQQSRKLGLAPLLYHCIRKQNLIVNLPADIQQRLREAYLASLGHGLQLSVNIELILSSLAQARIPVIPLKGAYLAEKVYENVGLRPMLDVDLLVPRENLAHAMGVLQGLGYQSSYPFEIDKECQVMHHLPPMEKVGATAVEIHWTLTPPKSPFQISIEDVWQAARPGTIAGINILEPAPEDLLLHLCLHAAYLEYFSSGLRPFCDIAWTLKIYKNEINWGRLTHQARLWRATRSTFLALKVAQELLHAPTPEGFLDSLQPAEFDPALIEWAITQILYPSEIGGKLAEVWAPHPWHERTGLFFQKLFPPPDEVKSDYPNLAHGMMGWMLVYLLNLGRIFKNNRRAVWKLLRGDSASTAAADQREKINRLVDWQGSE